MDQFLREGFFLKKMAHNFLGGNCGLGLKKKQGEIVPGDRSFGSRIISKPPRFFRGIFAVGFGEE